jgi:hypothetical protein
VVSTTGPMLAWEKQLLDLKEAFMSTYPMVNKIEIHILEKI